MPRSTTILITGASSGLGLSFLTHYITTQSPTSQIYALDTTPLPSTLAITPNTFFHQLDITSPTAFTTLSKTLLNTPIDLLIHCAGIRGLVHSILSQHQGEKDGVAMAEGWDAMDYSTMMKTLEVNTWGTFNVVRTFLPNLQKAASLNASSTEGGQRTKPKVVVLSSRMGSVSANTSGGGYAYRASKAGLNAIVKSFSIDVPEVAFLLLHPGRVETGLVGWKEEGAIGVEESLTDCLGVIANLGGKQEPGKELIESGAFVDRFGMRIEW
jgi:NAD(P)-dependent dehydrogenase (short-subunit alcohol dehydrogenase family)